MPRSKSPRRAAPPRGSLRGAARGAVAHSAYPRRRPVTDLPRRAAVGVDGVRQVERGTGCRRATGRHGAGIDRLDAGLPRDGHRHRQARRGTQAVHHLLDLVEPSCDFTVAEFQRAPRTVVAEIAGRGQRAILVGGTGLYHRAVIDDLDLPGEWPAIRSGLLAEAELLGPGPLHARLAALDPRRQPRSNPRTPVASCARSRCAGSGRPFVRAGSRRLSTDTDRADRPALGPRRVGGAHRAARARNDRRRPARRGARCATWASRHRRPGARLQGIGWPTSTAPNRSPRASSRSSSGPHNSSRCDERWFQRDQRMPRVDVTHDPVAEAGPIVAAASTHEHAHTHQTPRTRQRLPRRVPPEGR